MKTFVLLIGLVYSGAAIAALEWREAPEQMRFGVPGDYDTAGTAQFYCYYLKETDGKHWRLPIPDELIQASKLDRGLYWSSKLNEKRHGEVIVVDTLNDKLYSRPVSEHHGVYCVHGS